MKKIIILVLAVLALGGLYFFNNQSSEVPNFNSTGSVDKPDPSNATFTIDEEKVALSSGRLEREIEGGIEEEIVLGELFAYGDINSDTKADTAAVLIQSGASSGIFVYVVGYVSGAVKYNGTNAVFLGDRVIPQTLDIRNQTITVTYLDRRSDEPFAAEPTLSVTKNFVYRNGELQER